MNIALMAHDNKKDLMVQFCTAYAGILSKHTICATNITGKMVAEATGLPIHLFLARVHGGAEQIGAQTLEVAGGYHSMGLSGTLPAVFEKVRAGVVDFFVETLESNPASASAGASTEQGGMQSGQGSGSITFN